MKKHPKKRVTAKPSKPSTSTALVRLQRDVGRVLKSVELSEPAAIAKGDAFARSLTVDNVEIGRLGLVEIKLTTKEENILARAVKIDDVLIKPTGQPYISHPAYTRWFNEAFGRLGWAIVPIGHPQKGGSSVVVPHMLYIHGQPAAYAMGEQEYFESNREQTFGDAVEATVASALRRCAKRLGVGLELWDKRFLNRFMEQHCVKVWVDGDGKPKWRRQDDPPFWNERGRKQGDDERTKQEGRVQQAANDTGQRTAPRPAFDGKADVVISDAQRRRLWTIAKNMGRSDEELKDWLNTRYGYSSTSVITRKDYDAICKAVEARGTLPAWREPGED